MMDFTVALDKIVKSEDNQLSPFTVGDVAAAQSSCGKIANDVTCDETKIIQSSSKENEDDGQQKEAFNETTLNDLSLVLNGL